MYSNGSHATYIENDTNNATIINWTIDSDLAYHIMMQDPNLKEYSKEAGVYLDTFYLTSPLRASEFNFHPRPGDVDAVWHAIWRRSGEYSGPYSEPMWISAHKGSGRGDTIDINSYYLDDVSLLGTTNEVNVTVISNASIDVYIITPDDLAMRYPDHFSPVFKRLNTTHASFTWKKPNNAKYLVVVDNEVNNITGSADPTGSVVFFYESTRVPGEDVIGAAVSWGVAICSVMSLVIAIVIAVVVYLLMFKGKKDPGGGGPHDTKR